MSRNRQQTANRIKQAAICLLQREGFTGWGINAVAREAKVDKVLLYRYFESLDGLLLEIISETRFWPDPESLDNSSAVNFIAETGEFQQANTIARLLVSLPESSYCFDAMRDKLSHDLGNWLDGVRKQCDGHAPESQLIRLPAIIHFQYTSGNQKLTSSELWQQVSPPLQWRSEVEFHGFEELPTELL